MPGGRGNRGGRRRVPVMAAAGLVALAASACGGDDQESLATQGAPLAVTTTTALPAYATTTTTTPGSTTSTVPATTVAVTAPPVTTVPIDPAKILATLAPQLDRAIDTRRLPDNYDVPADRVPFTCPASAAGNVPIPGDAQQYSNGQLAQTFAPVGGSQPVVAYVVGYVFPSATRAAQFASDVINPFAGCTTVDVPAADGTPAQHWEVTRDEAQLESINEEAPDSYSVTMTGTFGVGEQTYQRQVRGYVMVVGNAVAISVLEGPSETDNLDADSAKIATTVLAALESSVRPTDATETATGRAPEAVDLAEVAQVVAGRFTDAFNDLPLPEGLSDSDEFRPSGPISCPNTAMVSWPPAISATSRSADGTDQNRIQQERVFIAGLGFADPTGAQAWIDQVAASANCGPYTLTETPSRPQEQGTSVVSPLPPDPAAPQLTGIVVRQQAISTQQGFPFRVERIVYVVRSGRAVLYVSHAVDVDAATDPATVNAEALVRDVTTSLGLVVIDAGDN